MEIRYEGITSSEKAKLQAALARLDRVLQASLSVGNNRIVPWFGNDAASGAGFKAFDDRRKKLADYVKNKCRLLTFVKKIVGEWVDCAEVEQGDLAQVIRSSFKDGGFKKDAFVPSGVRIFVLPSFNNTGPRRNFHTLTHELTHRVLLTTDWWYGEENCKNKASQGDPKCIDTAACWGWFYADVNDEVPV